MLTTAEVLSDEARYSFDVHHVSAVLDGAHRRAVGHISQARPGDGVRLRSPLPAAPGCLRHAVVGAVHVESEPVVVTGAFIAEQAEVGDDAKLYVRGGVVDFCLKPPPGYQVRLHLVVLLQAGADDTDKPYRAVVNVITPAGETETWVDHEISVDAHRGENRFWQWPLDFRPQTTGRYIFQASVGDGVPVAVPLLVIDDE